MNENETLEQWVERVNQEPIWREVAIACDRYRMAQANSKHELAHEIAKKLSLALENDVFSPHWRSAPTPIQLDVSSNIAMHATNLIISARQEITKKVPPKEKLWRALWLMHDECQRQQITIENLRSQIEELEDERWRANS